MTEITKETITTQDNSANTVPAAPVSTPTSGDPIVVAPVINKATNSQTIEYLIYFFFGAVEILLAFRLILKLMGASVSSAFVGIIYGITGLFILPFEGIFRRGFAQGLETTSVLEPSTLVAIIVYAILAWGIVKLTRISSGEQQPTVY